MPRARSTRSTPLSVVVGAIPGALPLIIGCVVFEGRISQTALMLFSLQFLWQFPHFWSIGWLGFEDYANAGYKLMPTNQKGERDSRIGLQAFLYALFLVPVSIIPYMLGVSGWVSAVVVVI